MAKSRKTTVTALCIAAGTSNTLADFAMSPKRLGVTFGSLFPVMKLAGFEFVITGKPPNDDLAVRRFTDHEGLRKALSSLPLQTGKSMTALSEKAGISLTVLGWVNGTGGTKTLSFLPVLKLLKACDLDLALEKNAPNKRAARRASVTTS